MPARSLILVGLIGFAALGWRAEGADAAKVGAATLPDPVGPFLARHCTVCHGGAKPKADLNLTTFADEAAVVRARKLWGRVKTNVESGDMPPEDRPRPSREEIDKVTRWIDQTLAKVDCTSQSDPGRVTIRRLNRAEYNNTIRDLVGIDFHPADDFPSDDLANGFDNNGDVLTLPPILLEKYLDAAEKICAEAIVTGGSASPGPVKTWEAEELPEGSGGSTYSDWGRTLATAGTMVTNHDFPRDGQYILRTRVFGQQAGPEPVRMAWVFDGKTSEPVVVKEVEKAPKVFERKITATKGRHRFGVAFLNDFYDEKAPADRRDRNLVVDYLEVQGPVAGKDTPLPASHRRILFKTATKANRAEVAREILDRFAARAYRRPVSDGEVARLVKFVDLAEQNGDPFERGIQLAVEAVLVSPQFLFRPEIGKKSAGGRPRSPQAKPIPGVPIGEYELASRVSYFLWSSMPDDELFTLAREGKMRTGDFLEMKVRRMVRDPKAKAFVENFADQWLQIRTLKTASPDRSRFPSFDEDLRSAMTEETERFFEAIMREDRSVLDLIDADFTYLNERLARHYGISGVTGKEFRRVKLSGDQRGGVLTQASVLTVTSNPTRTSPVKRGKWILDQILGTPPPPPPPAVPDLDGQGQLTGTLRQKMEQHRANPACASCHARMDPLGFGFENFDAIGAWRIKDGDAPVDASGKLPSGQTFRGPKELKAILRGREKEIARSLSEKMLTYALGRGVDSIDACALDTIVDGAAQDRYRFSRLVWEIVKSDPFQKRKPGG